MSSTRVRSSMRCGSLGSASGWLFAHGLSWHALSRPGPPQPPYERRSWSHGAPDVHLLSIRPLQAKEESIAAIFEAAQLKTDGKAKRVVVTGCLAQRYGAELAGELPEARTHLR